MRVSDLRADLAQGPSQNPIGLSSADRLGPCTTVSNLIRDLAPESAHGTRGPQVGPRARGPRDLAGDLSPQRGLQRDSRTFPDLSKTLANSPPGSRTLKKSPNRGSRTLNKRPCSRYSLYLPFAFSPVVQVWTVVYLAVGLIPSYLLDKGTPLQADGGHGCPMLTR